ncbi:hypothetical protein D3C71_1734470 [compost metagenome]
MHIHHQAEVVHAHLGERLVAQDACVVDQHIHPAPGVDGLLHHGLDCGKVGDGCAVGQRLAARSTDLIDHGLRSTHGTAAAVHRAAQIVDQHLGAARCQSQCMLAAQATACARHDGHTAFEINTHGEGSPVLLSWLVHQSVE